MHFHAHIHSSQSSRSPHILSFPLTVISMLYSAGFQCTTQARLKSVLPLNCCFLCNRICENGHYPPTLASKPQSPLLILFPHGLLLPKPSHAPEPMVENSSSGLSAPLPIYANVSLLPRILSPPDLDYYCCCHSSDKICSSATHLWQMTYPLSLYTQVPRIVGFRLVPSGNNAVCPIESYRCNQALISYCSPVLLESTLSFIDSYLLI